MPLLHLPPSRYHNEIINRNTTEDTAFVDLLLSFLIALYRLSSIYTDMYIDMLIFMIFLV